MRHLGFMVQTGLGGSPDRGAAQFYSKHASKDALGCSNLGVLMADGLGVERDDDAAVPLLHMGCADKIGEACRYLAGVHATDAASFLNQRDARFFCQKALEYGERFVQIVHGEQIQLVCNAASHDDHQCQPAACDP